MSNLDFDSDLIVIFEDICKELQEVEDVLIARFHIENPSQDRSEIRKIFHQMDLDNQLDEDEAVSRWHELFAQF